ncbi:MAG: serine/threonine-protein kinase [Myxococcota bacterium]
MSSGDDDTDVAGNTPPPEHGVSVGPREVFAAQPESLHTGAAASRVDGVVEQLQRDRVFEALFQVPSREHTLGRYVLLNTLGKGGMGIVLEAFDRTLDRKVAIKILHRELDDRQNTRLLREAQAMAKLSHPNVVQVFEAGRIGARTFVAMELVEGQTLRTWMQQEPPPRWQRCLELFIQVGQGLAAAHEQGLVHRDFKPSNAIIDRKGRPRVLDFGLVRRTEANATKHAQTSGTTAEDPPLGSARLRRTGHPTGYPTVHPTGHPTGQELALELSLTRTGAVLGTPAYMPPEQMKGAEADARSDQFSFCVALYEALYGQRPFEGRTVATLLDSIQRGALRPAPRGRTVPKALRTALLRGLAAEPTQRWRSMEALLVELRRLAAPHTRRKITWGVALGLMGLGGMLAVPQYLAFQQRCKGARAQLDGIWDDARRRQVQDAILETQRPHARNTWVRIAPWLDDYVRAWVDKHTQICEATAIRGEQTEEAMDLRMACLHDRKVALEAAVTVLADADGTTVDKAVTLVRALPPLDRCDDLDQLQQRRQRVPPPKDPAVAQQVLALREQLAEVQAEIHAGRPAAALEHADPLVERATALAYGPLLAEALVRRGDARERMDQFAEAAQDLEQAFTIATEHGHDTVAARSLSLLTWVVGKQHGDHERGLWWGQMALTLSLGPEIDATAEANALTNLGVVLHQQGELSEAVTYHQRALAIKERALGSDHPTVANILVNIGNILHKQGKLSDALVHHQRALAIAEHALGSDHPHIASILNNTGNVLLSQGKLADALSHYQRALAIKEQMFGAEHSSLVNPLINIGSVFYEQNELSEALDHYQRALAIAEHTLGPNHLAVASTLNNMASVLQQQGKLAEASEHYQRALTRLQHALGPDHPSVASALTNIGNVMIARGQILEALDHHQRALTIFEHTLGSDHPSVAYPLVALAKTALDQRDFETAREHAQRAVSICEAGDVAPNRLAEALLILAHALWEDPTERVRAHALAQQARDTLTAAEKPGEFERDLAKIDAWLVAHPFH